MPPADAILCWMICGATKNQRVARQENTGASIVEESAICKMQQESNNSCKQYTDGKPLSRPLEAFFRPDDPEHPLRTKSRSGGIPGLPGGRSSERAACLAELWMSEAKMLPAQLQQNQSGGETRPFGINYFRKSYQIGGLYWKENRASWRSPDSRGGCPHMVLSGSAFLRASVVKGF